MHDVIKAKLYDARVQAQVTPNLLTSSITPVHIVLSTLLQPCHAAPYL
jgi:hypothetical protein